FIHAEPFGVTDPIFDMDVSFYVFQLPFLESLYSVLSTTLFILIVVTVAYTIVHFFNNQNVGMNIPNEEQQHEIKNYFVGLSHVATKQIGIFIGLFFLLNAFRYFLNMFTLLYSSSSILYGAGFTDSVIRLNLYKVVIVVSLIGAVFSIVSGMRKKLKPLIIAPVITIAVIFLGGVVALLVENFYVEPNQFTREEPFIERHIEYTREAYGLTNVEEKEFDSAQNITEDDLDFNAATLDNIPINDYRPILDVYNSIQGFRLYYQFNDVDADRYTIDGNLMKMFVGARELDNSRLDTNAQTWVNMHLKYTHGFGVAASPANKVDEVGQPELSVKDIPPETDHPELELEEPRIYFGESTDTYAITNTKSAEFDYPDGSANQENFYDGDAGINISFLNRLMFAIHEGTARILVSSEINSDSKMLMRRNISERVSEIAPFLSYDSDPYVVVSEGRLHWIIDGFTTSQRYPYSQPIGSEAPFNYIRNSVKVVIDAYNGDVTYYIMEPDDPIVNVYASIYPDLFKPIEEMSDDLRSHVRYSQQMFDIQADMYRTYHMDNPRVFYNREDEWELPRQIYGSEKEIEEVESTYLMMALPEEPEEEFTLMVPFTARQRDNMVGWMAALNDGENYGDLIVYRFPKQSLVYGPMQIEQRIDQDTIISPQLTLLGQQGSQVIRGNMMTIPIEESIFYVEPIYIKAEDAERSIPEMKKVIVAYENEIVMADTLEQALTDMFGIETEGEPGESDEEGDESQEPEMEDPALPDVEIIGEMPELIDQANQLFDQAQQAQQEGNWAEYGDKIAELEEVLKSLEEMQQEIPVE
ncbi:MAG TPA: UPF0182 family protein, partial [Eubacteriaceae bacterium]|nr:UPF0182 family protein [Eubacteriaceae bacterium]